MPVKKTCIQLKNVSFSYGGDPVLEHIDVDIKDGEYVGIVGPNGGGKTTLIKLILGILEPSEGEIKIFGHTVEEAKQHYDVGYVSQKVMDLNVSFPATVEEVVASGRSSQSGFLSSSTKKDKEIIQSALEMTNLTEFRHRLIGSLSGGQRQRVFIARALAREPRILILDEPTVGVDMGSKEKFYSFLATLHKKFKLTILMISHDVDVVAEEVEKIMCINRNLVCHVTAKSFEKEDYFHNLYGEKGQITHHDH